MDKNNKKKKIVSTSSLSSASLSFDHIFGPRVSSSSSSSATGLFKSIFPPPSADQLGRQVHFSSQGGHVKYQSPNERGERSNKKEKKSYYNEETEPPCHLSSSLYYGGQEKYSSTTTTTQDTSKKMERKAIPKAHQEETGGKGRFITSNPDSRAPAMESKRQHAWSYLNINFEGSLYIYNKKKVKSINYIKVLTKSKEFSILFKRRGACS